MNFDLYQESTGWTAVYPDCGEGTAKALAYVGLGLGESGEIQNQLKKIYRDDNGMVTDERRENIAKEMGDLLWYLGRLADELGVSLNDVAEDNLQKLADRKERNVIQGSGDDR